MDLEQLIRHCEEQRDFWRTEAENLKKTPDILAWDMWYERAMGQQNAYSDMIRHISKMSEGPATK